MKYRKRPVEIEAIQWTGNELSTKRIKKFVGVRPDNGEDRFLVVAEMSGSPDGEAYVWDEVQETWVRVNKNDFIIEGIRGEFYPCEEEIFYLTYEAVE